MVSIEMLGFISFSPTYAGWSSPGILPVNQDECVSMANPKPNSRSHIPQAAPLEMQVNWLDKQVIHPDGNTIWEFPSEM